MTYSAFLDAKSQFVGNHGPAASRLPDFLFDFQRMLVEWAIQKGRAAIFADCGLGKTPMQLVWAENIVRHTNLPVLIFAPLAVAHQTVREAEKFGIESEYSKDGHYSAKVVVTNYERSHHFNPDDFTGVVCDESSCLKHFDAKRTRGITEFLRTRPYRLLCTATAAPNDYNELGTSSEALGHLGYSDMLTRFFKQEIKGDHLGWARTKYRLREPARLPFWRWVCSWSRAIRRPSDYGFADGPFVLPGLKVRQTIVKASRPLNGRLFQVPAHGLEEQREERRMTIKARCEKVAEMMADRPCSVAWCHLNPEGDLLEKCIDGAVQVSGRDSDDAKEEKLLAFQSGQITKLVTKQKIAGWGLNWQHCSHTCIFPSHSFEAYYQGVRRFLRFGQENDVEVDIVSTEGECEVLRNLQRKSEQADAMFESLLDNMKHAMHLDRSSEFTDQAILPSWMSQ